jgi:hypothetical protein
LIATPQLDLSEASIQRLNEVTAAVAFGWNETPLPAARK